MSMDEEMYPFVFMAQCRKASECCYKDLASSITQIEFHLFPEWVEMLFTSFEIYPMTLKALGLAISPNSAASLGSSIKSEEKLLRKVNIVLEDQWCQDIFNLVVLDLSSAVGIEQSLPEPMDWTDTNDADPPSLCDLCGGKPSATWLAPSYYKRRCYDCLRVIKDRFIPCRGCRLVRYCSVDCESKSWTLYHSAECKFMPVLKHMGLLHLVLKMFFISKADKSLRAGFKLECNCPQTSEETSEPSEELTEEIELRFASCVAFTTFVVRKMKILDLETSQSFAEFAMKTLDTISSRGVIVSDSSDTGGGKDGDEPIQIALAID